MRKLDFSLPQGYMERIVGFTIPEGGVFHLVDHDEALRVTLADPPHVEELEGSPYDFIRANPDFLGLHFAGEIKNEPVTSVGDKSLQHDFNPKNDAVTVTINLPGDSRQLHFPIQSGEWFVASFSRDGVHLVLAEPHNIAVYVFDQES